MSRTLANASAIDRSKTDYYPTPREVTIALINELNLPLTHTIWECACGTGEMSEVFKDYGYNTFSSDLHLKSYCDKVIDFLSTEKCRGTWIITNPPFSLSEDFIRKCVSFGVPFALLLKSQYWHSSRRRKLFEETKPRAVFPLTWRPDFLFGAKAGSPTMEVLWTVWNKTPATFTIYSPLPKPK